MAKSTVSEERIRWMLTTLCNIDDADGVRDAVHDHLEERFQVPAGELIDVLRHQADILPPEAATGEDRQMHRRLADELAAAYERVHDVVEWAGDAFQDTLATIRTDVAFRQWAARHGVSLFDDVAVVSPDEDAG
jgi:hypothetical protein